MRKNITGSVCTIAELSKAEKESMFLLMGEFYDNVDKQIFLHDLHQKDWCITLRDKTGKILGFSTQKLTEINIGKQRVHGIFSGDTIIHKEHWGSMELFRIFARKFIRMGEDYPILYWFLISKGYKTYKLLPTFFREFYPNYRQAAPPEIKAVIDAFGTGCYPGCYLASDGVIHYNAVKDRLKEGVADITASRMKDPDIAFFLKNNPGYRQGDDLVCLTVLKKENLIPKSHNILFGGDES